MGFALCFSSFFAYAETGSTREGLFSITPEQMVFASKLSESYRKIYCHKFSMVQRQEALEEWKTGQEDSSETAYISPDEAVEGIAEYYYPSHTDPLIDSGDTS
jgi:hypothetical protein